MVRMSAGDALSSICSSGLLVVKRVAPRGIMWEPDYGSECLSNRISIESPI